MDDQLRFLLWLAQRLEAAGIPYMVTGSLALAAYATPRMTRDIDLVVELDEGDVDRVVAMFEEDCYVDPTAVAAAVADRSMFNIIHSDWVVKADLVIRGTEPYRLEEFRRRQTISIEGVPVSFVRPEDLLLSKLLWIQISPSAQQERDIRDLLESAENLDPDYVERWADELDVRDSLERIRHE